MKTLHPLQRKFLIKLHEYLSNNKEVISHSIIMMYHIKKLLDDNTYDIIWADNLNLWITWYKEQMKKNEITN